MSAPPGGCGRGPVRPSLARTLTSAGQRWHCKPLRPRAWRHPGLPFGMRLVSVLPCPRAGPLQLPGRCVLSLASHLRQPNPDRRAHPSHIDLLQAMTAAPSVTWLTAAVRLTVPAGTSPWSTVLPHPFIRISQASILTTESSPRPDPERLGPSPCPQVRGTQGRWAAWHHAGPFPISLCLASPLLLLTMAPHFTFPSLIQEL